MLDRARLQKWVRRMAENAAESGGIRYFDLREKSSMGGRAGLDRVYVKASIDEAFIEHLVQEISEFSLEHARAVGGNVAFVLDCAFTNPDALTHSLTFDCHVTDDVATNHELNIDRGAKDIILVLLKENRTDRESIWGMTNEVLRRQEHMLNVYQSQQEKFLEKQVEMVTVIETLTSKRSDRELAESRAKSELDTTQRLADRAINIGSLVAHHLIAKKAPEALPAANAELLKALIGTMKEEQLGKLASHEALNDIQRQIFVGLAVAVTEGKDPLPHWNRIRDTLAPFQIRAIQQSGILEESQLAIIQRLLAA